MNKVSNHFRHVATYINSDDVRTTTYKYAELVERLVKAAEAVVLDAEEHDLLKHYQTVDTAMMEELRAALAAIQGVEVGNE